jgi:hypothetical protein
MPYEGLVEMADIQVPQNSQVLLPLPKFSLGTLGCQDDSSLTIDYLHPYLVLAEIPTWELNDSDNSQTPPKIQLRWEPQTSFHSGNALMHLIPSSIPTISPKLSSFT